jgi:hypothetical protein
VGYVPVVGTDQLQRRPTGVPALLLPEAGGRWVNKVNGRHYGYLTVEKPDGYEVTRISCHHFAVHVGEVAERVSAGETFEVFDHRRGEPVFYATLTPANAVQEADQRSRYAVNRFGRVKVYELLANETTAREVASP